MAETYLTVAEIAELLRLNQQTIRNWIDRGELPAVRVGSRRVGVKQSGLDRFLEDAETIIPKDEQQPVAPRLPRPSSASRSVRHSKTPVARSAKATTTSS